MLLAIVALAIGLRLWALDPAILHVDEALYASYGVASIDGRDPLLLHAGYPLDKLPLAFWTLGVVIAAAGDGAIAIRFPGLVSAAATVVAVYLIARELDAERQLGAVGAALLFALSPFAILFGATVFVDPPAVAIGSVAVLLAARGHPAAAGVTLGLAIGAKLFALAFAPLAIALLLLRSPTRVRDAIRLSVGFGVVAALWMALMLARSIIFGAPWFLGLQYEGVGGTGLVAPDAWPARIGEWWAFGRYLFVGPLLVVVLVGLAAAVTFGWSRRHLAVLAVAGFGLGYAMLLVAVRTPVYDRYLLYLVPPIVVVAGIGLGWLVDAAPRGRQLLAVVVVGLVVAASLPGAAGAVRGEYLTAERADMRYHGFGALCDWIERNGDNQTVVWNQALSWHLAYCLAADDARVSWYPDVSAITLQGSRMYLAHMTADDPDAVTKLEADGWLVELRAAFDNAGGDRHMWVYELTPAEQP